MKKDCFLIIFLLFLFTSCSEEPYLDKDKQLNLDQLNLNHNVFESGLKLMAMPNGLHELELNEIIQDTLVIAVHGNSSRGYEWVYPLQVINTEKNLITFFRWDDSSCIDKYVFMLEDLIQKKISEYKNILKIKIYGHSYGGLLSAVFMDQWRGKLPLEVHTIASPLKGINIFTKNCNYKTPEKVPDKTKMYEWRTIKNLDGAFKNLKEDPQNVKIFGSTVTRLPETYKKNKLGHNWSISWVVDKLNSEITD